MQGGEGPIGEALEHREVDHVGVEMDDVEVVGTLHHLRQHDQVCGQVRLERRRIQPDRLIAYGDETRARLGVDRGEQGDVVPQVDQGVGQVGDDAFGAAIQPGRHGLIQRRDLGDLHGRSSGI